MFSQSVVYSSKRELDKIVADNKKLTFIILTDLSKHSTASKCKYYQSFPGI